MTEPAPLDADAARRVGQTLRKKWHIDALLGVGAMGAVYSATHKNGRRAAIKILHAALAVDPALRRRLLREGYSANAVDDSGAVDVLDEDVAEDGCPFLVMELLEGKTFAELVSERGPLPVEEALELVEPVLATLERAHTRGIVHRDLKPSNMFLTSDRRIKICDFGLAELSKSALDLSTLHTSGLVGTPAFVSPEQARGLPGEVDARSDLWSVGATLFFLLTGRYAHEGRTASELLAHTITRAPRSIGLVRHDLPRGVIALVDRALRFEKADRFQSAEEMRRALDAALSERPRSSTWKFVAAVAAVVVVSGFVLARPRPANARLSSGAFSGASSIKVAIQTSPTPAPTATIAAAKDVQPTRSNGTKPPAPSAAPATSSNDPFAARF